MIDVLKTTCRKQGVEIMICTKAGRLVKNSESGITGFHHFISSNTVNRQPDNLSYTLLDSDLVEFMTDNGMLNMYQGNRMSYTFLRRERNVLS